MALPVELRVLIIGFAAMVLYFAVAQSSRLYAVILASLLIVAYLVLRVVEQRFSRQ